MADDELAAILASEGLEDLDGVDIGDLTSGTFGDDDDDADILASLLQGDAGGDGTDAGDVSGIDLGGIDLGDVGMDDIDNMDDAEVLAALGLGDQDDSVGVPEPAAQQPSEQADAVDSLALDAMTGSGEAGDDDGHSLEIDPELLNGAEARLVDVVVQKAPKPMGFGIKFGSVSTESLAGLFWPGKFEEPGVDSRTEYIIVSRLQDSASAAGVPNPAQAAGVGAGDVVLEMNGSPIFGTSDMKAAKKKGSSQLRLRLVQETPDSDPGSAQLNANNNDLLAELGLEGVDDAALSALLREDLGDLGAGPQGAEWNEKLNELGLDLNLDLGMDVDLSGVPGMGDDADLNSIIDGGANAVPPGRKLTFTLHRRNVFGFGIIYAQVAVDSIQFDFEGKWDSVEYVIVNRFKEFESTVGENPAKAVGLQPGDVILTINGTPVRDNSELAAALAGLKVIEIGIAREASQAGSPQDVVDSTPGIDRLLSDLKRDDQIDASGDSDINQILMTADISPMVDSEARRDLSSQLSGADSVAKDDAGRPSGLTPYVLSPIAGYRPSEIDDLLAGDNNGADDNIPGESHLGYIDVILQHGDDVSGVADAEATAEELQSYKPEIDRDVVSTGHLLSPRQPSSQKLLITIRPTVSPALWGQVGKNNVNPAAKIIEYPANGIKTVIYCKYGNSNSSQLSNNTWSTLEETGRAPVDVFEFDQRVGVVQVHRTASNRLKQELKFELVGFDEQNQSFVIGEAIVDVAELCPEGQKSSKRFQLSRRDSLKKRNSANFAEDSFVENMDAPAGNKLREINAQVTVVAEPMDPHRLEWYSKLTLTDLPPAQTCRLSTYGRVPIPALLEYLWRQALEAGALEDHEALAFVLELPAELLTVDGRIRKRFQEETRAVKNDITNLRFNAALVDADEEDSGPGFVGGFLGAKAAAEKRAAASNGRYSSMVYLFLWKTVVGTISPKLLSPASFQRDSSGTSPLTSFMKQMDHRKMSEIANLLRAIPEPGHTVLLWVLDRMIDIFEQSDVTGLDLRVLAECMTPVLWSSPSSTQQQSAAGSVDSLSAIEFVLVLLRWRLRWRQYASSFVGNLIELQAAKEAHALDGSGDRSGGAYEYLVDKQQISEGDESLLNLQGMDEIKRRMDSLRSKFGKGPLVVTALTAHAKYGIAIGTQVGATFVFNHFQKLQATLHGPSRSPVQCLAFAKNDEYIAVGYLNADLTLFDFVQKKQLYVYHEKRQLRSIEDPRMQAFSQVAFLDVPGSNTIPQIIGVDLSRAVWHLRFRRILNIWSVDPQLVVKWPTFRVTSVAPVAVPRVAAAQGMQSLVALTIVSPKQTVITEFNPKRKLVVSKDTVLVRLPVDESVYDPRQSSAILLAWRWTNDEALAGPILARSYAKRLEIFTQHQGEWSATPAAQHDADADIVAMEWLCEDRVLYLSNDHHVSIFDTRARKCVVTIRLQPWAVRGSTNGLTEYLAATCNQKFYFIALSGNADGKLGLVTMRPEDELMTIFISKNDWQKALSLGVQQWANARPDFIENEVSGLLKTYLRVHFDQEHIGLASHAAGKRDVLNAPECADLVEVIGMAFDFCLRCNRHLTKKLLEDLDKHCTERGQTATNIFSQLLIAKLQTGKMSAPSLASISRLIDHCRGSGRDLDHLERSLIAVQWSYDDAGDLIELCERNQMFHGLLIHLCTRVFDPADFLTPLRVITLTISKWDRPRLQQRLLLYLYCCFNGLRCPDGPQLSTSEATQALNSTLCELFGVANFDSHASPRSRARSAASSMDISKALPLSSPDHPLRILLYKMSAEFLAVLEPVIVRIWMPQGNLRRRGGRNRRRRNGRAGGGRVHGSGPGYNPYNPMNGQVQVTTTPASSLSAQLTLEQLVASLVIVSNDWVENSSGIDPNLPARVGLDNGADTDMLSGEAHEKESVTRSSRRKHVNVNRYEAQICQNIYAFVARLLLQRIDMPTPASVLWGTIIALATMYRRLVAESDKLDSIQKARKQGSRAAHKLRQSHAAMQIEASAVMRRRQLDLQLRTCRESVSELVSRVPSTTDLEGRDPMPMRAYNKLRSVSLYRYAAEFAKKAGSHTRALQAYLESPNNNVRQEAFQFLHEEARRHDAVLGDFDDFASGAAAQSAAAQRAQQLANAGGKVNAGILHLQQVVNFNLRRLLATNADKTGAMMQTLWGGLTTKYIRGVLAENPRNLLSQLRKLRLHDSCSSQEIVQLAIKHEAYEAAAELKWRDGATADSESLLIEGIQKTLGRLVVSFEASNKARFGGQQKNESGDSEEDRLDKLAASDAKQRESVDVGTEAITAYMNQAVAFSKESWERLNKSMAAFQAENHDVTKEEYQQQLEKKATDLWDKLLTNFLTFLKRFTALSDAARARLGIGVPSLSSTDPLRSSRGGARTGRRGTELEMRRNDVTDDVQSYLRRLELMRDFLHGCISRVLTDCRGQMRLDQVLERLLSDIAADSLKFSEIKFLVLDMLRGVEFERIALNISTEAARQAVICGKRLVVDPSQRASNGFDDDENDGIGGDADRKGSTTDLGQFFIDIEQGTMPFPTVLQQFMDEESTTSVLHSTNRNQRRNFGASPTVPAPRAKRTIQFPSQLFGGGALSSKKREKKLELSPASSKVTKSDQGLRRHRPAGGISLDF